MEIWQMLVTTCLPFWLCPHRGHMAFPPGTPLSYLRVKGRTVWPGAPHIHIADRTCSHPLASPLGTCRNTISLNNPD